jgi:branched-chain amino acid transport system substrate-binding protein
MKLTKVGAIAFAAMLIASACTSGGSPAPGGGTNLGTVTIGASDPIHLAAWGVLSTADATLGQDTVWGVKVALQDAGGKVLDHDINLTTQDGLCTPEGGATAAQALAADKSIVALIGPNCTDEVVGGIKAITEAGMLTISPSATRGSLTDPGRDASYAGFLRTAHSDLFQAKIVAEFLYNKLGVKTLATIHDGSGYAKGLTQNASDDFKALGGTSCDQEAIAKTDTDMKPVLTKISTSCSGKAPDALYYPIFIAGGGFVTAQVRDVPGMETVKLMGSDGLYSPDFIKAAGPNVDQMYLSSPDTSKYDQTALTKFHDEYKALAGVDFLAPFHAQAYDATNMVLAAIQKVAVKNADGSLTIDRKALRDAVYATKDFKGITGTLTCNASGDCGAPILAVYQITPEVVADPTKIATLTPIYP